MKLMERVKANLRVKRYSLRTEKTYCYWIRFFIRFHRMRHPANMAGNEVRQFLEHLAIERRVAAATQNQALNAIIFLYRHVLEEPLGETGTFKRAKHPQHYDHIDVASPCISPTRLLHSTNEQLDGVPVKSG